jgi:alpha-tubulin suppressor-like RCC1 family protein
LLLSLILAGLLPNSVAAAADLINGTLVITRDPVQPGSRSSYSTPTDTFTVASFNTGNVQVAIFGASRPTVYLGFKAPGDQPLVPATYVRPVRNPDDQPLIPGMDVSGIGNSCYLISQNFEIKSIVRDGDNAVTGLHLTFEQICMGGVAFRGDLRVGAPGPDAPKPTPQIPVVPDTTAVPAFLNMTSDPGDFVGSTHEYSFEASDLDHFQWVVEDNELVIKLQSAEMVKWELEFSDPVNRRLVPGNYTQTRDGFMESSRGFRVGQQAQRCSKPEYATFNVTRADYRQDGSLENFQASFYQRCGDLLTAGALRGQVSLGLPLEEQLKLNDPASGWGYNGQGELGNASNRDRTTAAGVAGSGFYKVAAGGLHSLGLKDDGSVWAWGWNGFGQLGDGSLADRSTPVKVPGLENVAFVSAGFYNSVAVKRDGTVWTWGWNGYGQAGDGTRIDRRRPVKVRGLDKVVEASAGMAHILALRQDRSVWAWGWNGYGQVGDGTTTDRLTPVKVKGMELDVARHVSAGGLHSLALAGPGVKSWGSNVFGQLGDGTNIDRHTPVNVKISEKFARIVNISAGLLHSVAASDHLYSPVAWGWNGFGQLGDGTTVDRNIAVVISGMEARGDVSAGCYHSLGTKKNGAVASWGWDGFGQLGNGTRADTHVATEIAAPASGHKTIRVAAGCLHSLGVHRNEQ